MGNKAATQPPRRLPSITDISGQDDDVLGGNGQPNCLTGGQGQCLCLLPAQIARQRQQTDVQLDAQHAAMEERGVHHAIEQMENQMREAAKKFEFERAAGMRDRIRSLKQRDLGELFAPAPPPEVKEPEKT